MKFENLEINGMYISHWEKDFVKKERISSIEYLGLCETARRIAVAILEYDCDWYNYMHSNHMMQNGELYLNDAEGFYLDENTELSTLFVVELYGDSRIFARVINTEDDDFSYYLIG